MKTARSVAQWLYDVVVELSSKSLLQGPDGNTVVFGKMRHDLSQDMNLLTFLRVVAEGDEGALAILCRMVADADPNLDSIDAISDAVWKDVKYLDDINVRGPQIVVMFEYYEKDISKMLEGARLKDKGAIRHLQQKAVSGETDGWIATDDLAKQGRKSMRGLWA